MSQLTNKDHLLTDQYKNSASLNARARIHQYGTNKQSFGSWVFEQLDLPAKCRILELGCGTGGFWKSNLDKVPQGWKCALTDLSPGMTEEARGSLGGDGRFAFEVADAQSIPFEGNSFDAVIGLAMLYHVPDRARALSEIRRVLHPGGRVYLSTVGRHSMREFWDLVAEHIPNLTNWHQLIIGDGFCLENGVQELEPFFEDVKLLPYDDDLMVTEVQPLIDYVLSLDKPEVLLAGDGLEAFRRAVEEEIQRNGALRISKSNGLLVAGTKLTVYS